MIIRDLLGSFFTVISLLIVLFFWVMAIMQLLTARFLQKRKCWIFCQIVAGIECLSFPIGTALGVFTVIVLQRSNVAAVFKKVASSKQVATDEDQA